MKNNTTEDEMNSPKIESRLYAALFMFAGLPLGLVVAFFIFAMGFNGSSPVSTIPVFIALTFLTALFYNRRHRLAWMALGPLFAPSVAMLCYLYSYGRKVGGPVGWFYWEGAFLVISLGVGIASKAVIAKLRSDLRL